MAVVFPRALRPGKAAFSSKWGHQDKNMEHLLEICSNTEYRPRALHGLGNVFFSGRFSHLNPLLEVMQAISDLITVQRPV